MFKIVYRCCPLVFHMDTVDRGKLPGLFVKFYCLSSYVGHVCLCNVPALVLLLKFVLRTCLIIVRLCSIPFSRRIAYWYAIFELRVCVYSFSAIFSFFICAVNMYLAHSSSQSPQSAPEARQFY